MRNLVGTFTVLVLAFGLAMSIVNAADVISDMVGYWPLDGNAKDSIGGKDGELVGGAKWVKGGRIKDAVEFDGSSGHVEISGFNLTTDTLTVVAWLNGWRSTAWTGIVVARGGTPFWMGFTDQDTLSYVWNNNAGDTWGWRAGPKIPENEWAMTAIAIEPKKTTSYIYSDAGGLKKGENNIAHIEQTLENLKFGWDECCGADRHFAGIIDEVMIYDRTLTEDDILKLATSGLAVDFSAKLTSTWGRIKQ
ncbi:LamG domain-containing protein [bacterium]|nr:LamG domain-containing protein [bacterium]